MSGFLAEYPYLFGTLAGLAVVGGLAAFSPGHRRWAALSGLLATPTALYSLVLIPEYWHPRRVAVVGIGPEDVLFMFGAGAFAWLMLARFGRLTPRFAPTTFARRLAATYGVTVGLAVVLATAGLPTMVAAIAAGLAWGSMLLGARRDLVRMVAAATLSCTLVYTAFLLLAVAVWPTLREVWTWPNVVGPRFGPVPLEELAWAVAFFPVWGLSMAYVFDAESAQAPVPIHVARHAAAAESVEPVRLPEAGHR